MHIDFTTTNIILTCWITYYNEQVELTATPFMVFSVTYYSK